MRRYLFALVISFQFILIFFLFFKIQAKRDLLQKVSINVIPKNSIVNSPTKELKYFFEPLPNSTEEAQPSWLSEKAIYRINSDGLNERYEYKPRKDPGTYRIITIGDSFTFGVNISTQFNWTELLEDELNKNYTCNKIKKYEVINLGVGTYDTDYEIQRYKIRGQKYDPDVIIWYIIDIRRFTDRVISEEQNINIDDRALEKEGIFYESWRLAQEKVLSSLKNEDIYNLQLSKVRNLMNSIPTKNYLFPIADDNLVPYKERLDINNNSYFMTLHPGECAENLLADGHYNKQGHVYVKDRIVAELLKDGLIPCGKK